MKLNLRRQYIYDIVQRILHWWLALSVIALAISGFVASEMEPGLERAQAWVWHMNFGNVLLVGFVGRVLWGIIGPEHARFTSLIHIKTWMASLKTKKMLSADGEFGHHPQASISYIGFYGLLATMVITGVVLSAIMHGEGPLAEKLLDEFQYLDPLRLIHEYAWWAIVFFIVTHVGALIYHEWADKIPLAQSMISGYQYRSSQTDKEQANDDAE